MTVDSNSLLRDRYEEMSDGQLLYMVEADGRSYSDEAIKVALQILAERGIEATPQAPPTAEERIEAAKDLRLAGFNRVLWGGVLCTIGVGLSFASDGQAIFYGAAICGGLMLFSGLAARGGAESLEKEVAQERKAEIERTAGNLSEANEREAGAVSEADSQAALSQTEVTRGT